MAKVQPGDALSIDADDWNTLLDIIAAFRSNTLSRRHQPQKRIVRPGVVVTFKNNTGSDLARFHAVGIGAPLFTHSDNAATFLNQLAFNGESQSNVYLGQFAVAQEAIPDGDTGGAMLQGITPAEITVGDADHTHVDVDGAGGSKLVSAFSGAGEILWKESGTGTKWALLRIGATSGDGVVDDETGTGTGTGTDDLCINRIGGVILSNLPVDTNPSYALGIDSTGCLVLIPIGSC